MPAQPCHSHTIKKAFVPLWEGLPDALRRPSRFPYVTRLPFSACAACAFSAHRGCAVPAAAAPPKRLSPPIPIQPVLFSTAYLPPVQYVAHMLRGDVRIEACESFQKQTYRNRCVIDSPNGPLPLTIPVEHPRSGSRLVRDLRISEHGHWRHLHWQALASSYFNSPYFEYFQDDLRPFYERRYTFLLDFNEEMLHAVLRLMDLDLPMRRTDDYAAAPAHDLRALISPKRPLADDPAFVPVVYYQVFAARHGFLPNLSVTDLLFNMGPESVLVLRDSLRADAL